MVEQDKNEDDMLEAVRESVDFSIVADNIVGIADYVIEKHEFRSGQTLSPEMRSAVVEKIKEVLWHQAGGPEAQAHADSAGNLPRRGKSPGRGGQRLILTARTLATPRVRKRPIASATLLIPPEKSCSGQQEAKDIRVTAFPYSWWTAWLAGRHHRMV